MELVSRVCAIGEGMLELSRAGSGWQLAYGGDVLNMAIHLARYGLPVSFATALGADPFSDDLRRRWRGEGLDTDLILTDPARMPGLYAIRTDDQGERSFHYWRDSSAARRMFGLPGIESVLAAARDADLLVYSLITLAVLPPDSRDRLFDLCRALRARGGRVAFDGNYRPRLWPNAAEACAARDLALSCCDIGLPTLEDERQLDGSQDAAAVAAHWSSLGVGEVVVKLGAEGCRSADGRLHPPPARLTPLDSSGAGDAFNAGYLQARLAGAPLAAAAAAGHRLAGWVVGRHGAIPPRDDSMDYSPYSGA